MSTKHQCLRGMRDLTPTQSKRFEYIENILCNIAKQYGFSPIRFPILEDAELFKKSIGIETDIIGSEMYAFEDKSNSIIALRPEGTAGCLRSVLANSLIQRDKQKLYYLGPMFRRERPQMGRYRQFQQFGIEVFGMPSGLIDAEIIDMTNTMLEALGIKATLHVNYLGSPSSRKAYRDQLAAYWMQHTEMLSDAEKTRAQENPLRLLDSKNPDIASMIDNAPKISDALSVDESNNYQSILASLNKLDIPFIQSEKLVRGLDYYSDFIFEWISDDLGAQSTVVGGGRYDPLTQSMGHDIPATGFAIGIDRLEQLLPDLPQEQRIYCAFDNQALLEELSILLYKKLEFSTPIYIDQHIGKFKSKLNNATQQQYSHFAYFNDDMSIKLIDILNDKPTTLSFDEFTNWYLQQPEQ